jgi:hypothetical protein
MCVAKPHGEQHEIKIEKWWRDEENFYRCGCGVINCQMVNT